MSATKSPKQKRKARAQTVSITDPSGHRQSPPKPFSHETPPISRKSSTPIVSELPMSPAVPARPSPVALSRLASSGVLPVSSANTPPVPSRPSKQIKEKLVLTAQATLSSLGAEERSLGDSSPRATPSPRRPARPHSMTAAALVRTAPPATSPRPIVSPRGESDDTLRNSQPIKSKSPPEEEQDDSSADEVDSEEVSSPEETSSRSKRSSKRHSRLQQLSSSSMLLSRSAIQRAATDGSEVSDSDIGVKVKQPSPQEEPEKKNDLTGGIQWKRSPDAEKIMELLMLEGALKKPEVKTVEVDRSLAEQQEREEAERKAAAAAAEQEEKKKKKLLRRSRKGNDGFVITRGAGAAGSLAQLEQELSSVKRASVHLEAFKEPKDVDPRAEKRLKIATEIKVSERAYTRSLQCLVENYMKPLCSQAANKPFYGIDASTIKDIFSNVTLIQNVNTQLYNDLEERLNVWDEQSTIGDIFMDVAPYFKMYNQYGNNYESSIEKLNDCMKVPSFASAVEKCDESHQLGNKFEALLIAPIQRIPRYLLLLRDLQASTDESHPDYQLLESALPLMQGIADYINQNIKQAEKMKKFMEISSGGAKALMQAHRMLQFEGVTVDIKSSKTKYHLYIFNDIIIVIPESKAKNKELLTLPHYQWPLHLVWYTYHSDSFKLQGPDAVYHMKGLNAEETQNWQKMICTAQAEHMQSLTTTQDMHLQKEREANMSVSDLVRFGSFQFENGAIYEGQWKDGIMEGHGSHRFLGNHFVGIFHGGKKTGRGVMKYMTGGTFSGDWLHDRPHGKGEMVYPNGDRYEGFWLNGLRSGDGKLTCVSGDSFDGKWAKDKPEGLGTMTYRNGATYIGNWKAGRRHCQGILTVPEAGQTYEGNWVEGMREGAGKMTWNDGTLYEGQWKQNQRHGKGIYNNPSLGLYNGEWLHDAKDGVGTEEYLDGNVYIGSWKRGLYHGQGKLTFAAGTVHYYEGEWVYGKKHGKGVISYFNGDQYEGMVKDDVLHGAAEYTFACGSVLEGKWVKGKAEGKVTLRLMPSREVVTGTCKDGYVTEKGFPPLQFQTLPAIDFSP